MWSLLVLLLLGLGRGVLGTEHRITSVEDFVQFVDDVNTGKANYSGTTVFLDTDLSLSGKTINPIGGSSNNFLGIFDGQGHIFSNLIISSYSQYTGLFGYSIGLTIRNLVIDHSCSIKSSYSGSPSGHIHIGGIAGSCSANNKLCVIETVVNLASVTFDGSIDMNLYLGGITGHLSSSSDSNVFVKNCVNYGLVAHSGKCPSSSIGGLVGYLEGAFSKIVQNSINYGTIKHNDTTTSSIVIGGIVGSGVNTQFLNCLSAGKIVSTKSETIGAITGYTSSNATISYCYFTSDVGVSNIWGGGHQPNITETPNSMSAVDPTLVGNLNDQVTEDNGFSRWILLHLNGGKINAMNKEMVAVTVDYLPEPVKEGEPFLYWCEDENCNTKYDPKTSDLTKLLELYAIFGTEITVLFNATGGNAAITSKIVIINGRYGDLPTPSKEGFTFIRWFTEDNEEVTSKSIVNITNDHTLYAKWTANNYTVTFNAMEGNLTLDSKRVTFDSPYGDLPIPTREWYTFTGWFTERNNSITSGSTVNIPYDHTLYAKWEEIPFECVEIVFGTKDLSDDKIREVVKKYVGDEKFLLTRVEDEGELRVIIKFEDAEKAENFIEKIRASSEMSGIKKIRSSHGEIYSLSIPSYPILLLGLAVL